MLNTKNIIKYLILFSVVSLSTFMIPNCSIMNKHAMYIGLLAGTTFVLSQAGIELPSKIPTNILPASSLIYVRLSKSLIVGKVLDKFSIGSVII